MSPELSPRGVVTDWTYDDLGRPLTVSFPASPAENVTYTYDDATPGYYGIGRMASVTDDSGSIGFRHDADGNTVRVETVVGAQTYITEYAYDAIGRLTSVTYPSGRLVDYTYDSVSRLATVATRANLLATPVMLASGFTYEAFGGLDGFTYGNGITLALGDDLNGRMVAMDAWNGGTPILDLDYTHDLGGRITDIDDIGGGNRGRNYTYDNLHRLTQAQELASGGSPVTLQTDYTYDAVGNRLTRNAGGALDTLAYDAFSNRLDTVTAGPVRTLTYSASGNTASDDDGAGTVLTFIYDSTDRLVEVKQGVTTVAAYLHNTNGQRVAKTIGATTTHYVYGPGGLIAEADGGTGATQVEYISLGGMKLAYITGGAVYYIHADHLGTPQRITDAAAAIVWDADYRPFGEATVSGALTFNLRFPGQYHDSETALHYNGMRDYDAATGRYVQSDPIGLGGGWNTYAYVSGNPIAALDRQGLVEELVPAPPVIEPEETFVLVFAFSDKHINRNMYNQCPASPPEKDCEEDSGYTCSRGLEWTPDPDIQDYHGKSMGNTTFRHTVNGDWLSGGWQCTYSASGGLVNSGLYQGTYDYFAPDDPLGFYLHMKYDVLTHEINNNYTDYLTRVY